MKKANRMIRILLALCMLVGTIGVLPVSAIEYSSDYAISNVTYVPTGTLGSTQDMLQWSDVGAISYRLEIYDENDIVIDYVIQNENYIPATQILPYSGKFYVVVVPLDENNVSVWSGTASEMFTYTDTTAPTVAWLEDGTVRSSDSEATVQFDNFDHLSACTYYYAVVDNGATAPTIDTSGTGIAANDGSDNYINLTDLTAGAKDIYLILKDQDGNAGEPIMTTIPAYEASEPEQTYSLRIHTTADGYGTTTDVGGTVTGAGTYKAGETVTLVATPNDGYCTVGYASHEDDGTRLYDIDLPLAIERRFTVSFEMPAYDFNITVSFYDHRYSAEDLGDGTHLAKCYYCDTVSGTAESHADEDGDGYCDDCSHSFRYTVFDEDESKHILYCWQCEKAEGEPAPHTDADGDEYCDDCDFYLHIHTQGEWQYDDEAHWYFCTACENEYAGYGEHDHSELRYENDKHFQGCVCGKYLPTTVESHTFTGEWKISERWHWQLCECGAPGNLTEHTSSGVATEDKAEVCTVCGYEITPALGHQHSYSSEWSSDANGHWHKCSCGATSAFAEHTSSGAATADAAEVCTVCGYEISPELGHQHSYASVWLYDETCHWRDCSCGGKFETAAHTSSGAASYGIPETCTVCGYEIAPAKTTYSLTVNYEIYASDGAIIGSGIESKTIEFAPGTVVDLSDYWPEQMTSIGNNGTTYYFRGFSYSTDGGGNYYNAVTVSENTVMYAAWVRQNMVTVEFDTNDGAMSYKRARAGATYTISDMNSRHIPVRAGYDFVGWSLADDGTADSSDTEITADCTLYAVWQTYMPSYDDSWNPPAPGTTVEIGGDYDAVRISDGVIGKVIDNGNEVVVKFPDGTSGTLTDSALVAAKENLQDGESLQIAIKNVGSEVLPNSLTEKEPFEDDDGITHYSVFTTEGIFTYDELSEFGVFGGTDESISWGDMKLLYQYMTTEDLEKLYNRFSGGSEDLVPFVDWLNEMIEQDAVTPLNMQELMNMADLTDEQLEFLADMELNDPTIGQLRQAGLTVEQMRKLYGEVRILIGELNDNDKLSDCNELLGWLEDAIAQKELEASYEQMDEWIAGLSITDYGGKALDDAKLAAESMTTEELERFLENARETNMMASSLALGELISFLEDELEARESNDTPTYINTSGTNDGINPIFIGAVDVNIGAVKADGTTTPIAIKADRSDAFSEINSQKSEEPKHNMRLSRKKWRKFYVRSYDEKQRIVFTNFQYLGNEICDKRMLCV